MCDPRHNAGLQRHSSLCMAVSKTFGAGFGEAAGFGLFPHGDVDRIMSLDVEISYSKLQLLEDFRGRGIWNQKDR